MIFKFKWFSAKRNRWYENTYYDWNIVEVRLNNLNLFGVKKIVWLIANLD